MPLPSDCQLSLMPDIPLDNFRGHLVPYTARIISGAPKMTAPKLPAQLWKLPKQHLCRHRLERAHNPPGRPLWRRLHKQVHVVRHQLQLDNLQPMVESNLTKDLSQPLLDSSHQQGFAILRRPHQVVLQIVDRMFGPPEHTGPLSYRKSLCPLATGPYIPDLPVGALRAIGKNIRPSAQGSAGERAHELFEPLLGAAENRLPVAGKERVEVKG